MNPRFFKLFSYIFLFLLTILLSLHFFLFSSPSKWVEQAENALASDDLVILAHLNHRRFYYLNELIPTLDFNFEQFLSELNIDVKPAIIEDLYQSPLLAQKLQHLVFGARLSQDDDLQYTWFLQGQFSWSQIRAILSLKYHIKEINTVANKPIYQLEDKQKSLCSVDEKAPLFYLQHSREGLLLSNQKSYINEIISRFTENNKGQLSLSDWRQFRSNKTLSVGLLSPQLLKGSHLKLLESRLALVKQDLSLFNAFYWGLNPSYSTLGVSLHSLIQADEHWIAQHYNKLTDLLERFSNKQTPVSEQLYTALPDIDIKAKQDKLKLRFDLFAGKVQRFPEYLSEILNHRPQAVIAKERWGLSLVDENINDAPWDYKHNQTLAELKAYDDSASSKAMFVEGALAVNLRAIEQHKTRPQLELSIRAEMQTPSLQEQFWRRSGAVMSLSLHSVTDKNNNELLKDEHCLPNTNPLIDNNHHTKYQLGQLNKLIYVDKKVRLIESASFDHIEQIKGRVSIKIPSELVAVKVEHRVGERVSFAGLNVFVKQTSQQSVSYQLSGNTSLLQEVRAYNKQGKVLKVGFSWGKEQDKTITYQGDIDNLKFYLAQNFVEQVSDFSIPRVSLFAKKNDSIVETSTAQNIHLIGQEQWHKLKELDKSHVVWSVLPILQQRSMDVVAESYLAPVHARLSHSLKHGRHSQTNLHLLFPYLDNMKNNLNSLEYRIGKNLNNSGFVSIASQQDSSNKTAFYLSDKADLKLKHIQLPLFNSLLEREQNQYKLAEPLNAELVFRFPSVIQQQAFDLPTMAKPVQWLDYTVSLEGIKFGIQPHFSFAVTGPVESLLNMILMTKSGEKLYPFSSKYYQGSWLLDYEFRDDIDFLELIVADELVSAEYKLELKTTYPNE